MTRVLGLDALRGLAILLMCLSGVMPAAMPNWMYHGYLPAFLPDAQGVWQPAGQLGPRFRGDWASFTWVDWVFPLFLFAMGCAIPLALTARRAAGASIGSMLRDILGRFVLLMLFAVYVQQVTVGFIDPQSTDATRWAALLGFVLPFAVFTRMPRETPRSVVRGVRLLGYVSCAALLMFINTRPGRGFSWGSNDIIILLLAHTFLVSALLWLLTARLWWLRVILALPVMLLAHHAALNHSTTGELFWLGAIHPVLGQADAWVKSNVLPLRQWLDLPAVWAFYASEQRAMPEEFRPWLNFAPLWDFTWYKYLWCVIPGTIVGDWLVRSGPMRAQGGWGRGSAWVFTMLVLLVTAGLLVGLRNYRQPGDWPVMFQTPWLSFWLAVPCAIGLAVMVLLRRAHDTAWMRKLCWLATITLAAGLTLSVLPFESHQHGIFERGISKGPPSTLSWYLVSVALGVYWLMMLGMWIDARGAWGFGLLTANGQNPMLAYIGIRNLLLPLVTLPLLAPLAGTLGARTLDQLFLNVWLEGPWQHFGWAVLKTLLLAVIVWGFTRRRIIWRT